MSLNLIDYINNKTDGRFYFLKLSEIFYSKKEAKCYVTLIYPQDVEDLSKEDQEIITKHTVNFLGIKSVVDVKIRKSYMDENLIFKSCIKFFNENAKSIESNFNEKTLKVSVSDKVCNITIDVNRHVAEYLAQKEVKLQLQTYLNTNYCGSFIIDINNVLPDEDNSAFLQERQKRIEEISYATAYAYNQNRRFEVCNIKPLFGDEIDIMPEHIIDGEAEGRVFAGKVKYLTQRSFTKTKKDKEGNEIDVEKPYFTFILQDGSKSINASYFPTKANYHKMNLLEEGATILVKGDVKIFREKFSLSVRAISLCDIVGDAKAPVSFKKAVSGYNFVSPEAFVETSQESLFALGEKNNQANPKAVGKTYVVFDLETTGLNPLSDEIIEIGAVKVVDGRITETFSCLVKPSFPIPAEATAINNITNEMVADAYSINQVFPDFFKFCEGSIMLGHNAMDFDFKFVDNVAKIMGYKMPEERLDTLLIAREKLSHLRHHNLKTICGYLGVDLVGAHRAVNDTVATAQVFLKLL